MITIEMYNVETEEKKEYFIELIQYYLFYSEGEKLIRESVVSIFENMDFETKNKYSRIEKIVRKVTFNKKTKRYSRKEIARKTIFKK